MNVKIRNTTDPLAIIDDEKEDTLAFTRALKKSKLENPPLIFHDGQTFLDYMERAKNGENPMPAGALLDINMPGLSGFEVLKAIREDPILEKVPIIIMLTSSNYILDKEKAKDLGCSEYQVKPDSPKKYVHFLNNLY